MQVEKLVIKTDAVIPLIAALPYSITIEKSQNEIASEYDAINQVTIYAGKKDYSTCRVDDSVPRGMLQKPKSDTKKDD